MMILGYKTLYQLGGRVNRQIWAPIDRLTTRVNSEISMGCRSVNFNSSNWIQIAPQEDTEFN